ncbi:MAG: asparagine synthetase B, partial [bacterium]
MCGLIAWVTSPGDRPDPERLVQASECMSYRGPDDQGVARINNVGLAHRRLSILDLSERGHQPMKHVETDWQIIYNGEIYNYRDIRKNLKRTGYEFQSNTDTEVLLKGWVEWGEDVFQRVNGMYAVVLFNPREESLVLARDLFGMKPLYIFQDDGQIVIGSEIKGILEIIRSSPQLDPEGLNEYLAYQNFFTDCTLIEGIRTIEPGVVYEFDTDSPMASPQKQTIQDIHFSGEYFGSKSDAQREIEVSLRNSVRRHMISDVPVNSYLSGGIDSSTICMLAGQHRDRLKTFTVGFDMS